MMKAACMAVCSAVLLLLYPAPLHASDLLVLTPFGSRSVRSLFSVLTEGLAARGHTVTLVSSGDPVPSHPNVTHIVSPHSALDKMDLFELREFGEVFRLWMKAFPAVARELYSDPKVMDLWRRRNQFDAIIINSAANEMAFPFLLDTVAPFITLAPVGAEPLQLSYLGNVVSPAALPSVVVAYDNTLTLWERLVNTITILLMRYSFRKTVGYPLAITLRDTFPELPDPFELYPQQALSLLNQHHLLDGSVPLLPNQVEVGCMHCRPGALLTPEIAEWMDGAGEAGVVYFSLGSFQNTSRVPTSYRDTLLQAFASLPHRVLIKFTGTDLQLSSNVRAYSWLPQQDILDHPATKVFITHCGKHSAAEALYHGVPMVGLPITFDQPRTCARLARRGEGVVLQWEQLTPQALVDAIYTIVNDTRYQERVEGVSRRLKAQKETGLEKAVWWVEYIIEHGNDYLRFSGADLSLAQYLLLDVMAIIGAVALVIAVLLFYLVRSIFKRFWPSRFWPLRFWLSRFWLSQFTKAKLL